MRNTTDIVLRDTYDLAVIGGGSGGYGAACAAARRGLSVLLVEPGPMLGGNSTLGGVNTWEPGIGGPGFHGQLFDLLSATPHAIGLSRTTKFYTSEQPWGFSSIMPPEAGLTYADSLRRAGVPHADWVRVTFDPDQLAGAMAEILNALGGVDVLLGWRFLGGSVANGRIESVDIAPVGPPTGSSERTRRVRARFFVDATAQIHVCRALGCPTRFGAESREQTGEPSAPDQPKETLNAVSVCFRLSPREHAAIDPLPPGVPDEPFVTVNNITQYPNGDLNINPLPIMEGMEFHRMGDEAGRAECVRRVHRLLRVMQTRWGFEKFGLARIFPFTGVREGPRLEARTMLTETEIRKGCSGQGDAGEWITLADHALDVHGQGGLCRELPEPYGVPWECLLPPSLSNLAVACRGAGVTHIAASSCRLSRTMMQMGHAAGLAAAVALDRKTQYPDVDRAALQKLLREDRVHLTPEAFPAPPKYSAG
ncbi:MAG: FAD-dependent oxidoreductase [Planctomycetota bacterium]|nr:FAD-dependent oxidoreductase [Planctomycetota bacterium]